MELTDCVKNYAVNVTPGLFGFFFIQNNWQLAGRGRRRELVKNF